MVSNERDCGEENGDTTTTRVEGLPIASERRGKELEGN